MPWVYSFRLKRENAFYGASASPRTSTDINTPRTAQSRFNTVLAMRKYTMQEIRGLISPLPFTVFPQRPQGLAVAGEQRAGEGGERAEINSSRH